MNALSREALEKLHGRVITNLRLQKKLKDDSVLISLLNIKSNECYKLLLESSLRANEVSKVTFDELVDSGLIRPTDKQDRFAITVKGAWEIEAGRSLITSEKLLRVIDLKFFALFGGTASLTAKEKVILLAMIAVRSFSPDSSLDLKRGDTALTALASLLESTSDLLYSHGVVNKLSKEDLFGGKGNEHPVSHLIRHTDGLLKKTRGIYQTLGQQKYFLSVSEAGTLSEDSLSLLFGLIFGSRMSTEMKSEVERFCLDKAYELCTYIYDLKAHRFVNPSFDDAIVNSLEYHFASRYKWEKS